MDCNMLVISPVHIGSGNRYGSSEYLKFNTKSGEPAFKRINTTKFYNSLDFDEKNDLLDVLSDSDSSLEDFIASIDKKNINKEYIRYLACNDCENNISSKNEIIECIKTLNHAYIPGSSLKGAIKTAIFHHCIVSKWDLNNVNRFLKGRFDNGFSNKFFTSNVERVAPAQKNIMRFLQVSDSTNAKQISIHDIHVKMASFSKNVKSNYVYNGNNGIFFLETINSGSKLQFNIKNNFNKKFYHDLNLNDKIGMIDIDEIKQYIYEFSQDLIEFEMKFARDYGFENLLNFYEKNKKYNEESKPLLRVGYGSGFLATTLGLKIKELDYNLYRKLIENKNAYKFCFPKSRKLTCENDYPLGWVKLSFKE